MTQKLVMIILLCIFFAGCTTMGGEKNKYGNTIKVSKKRTSKAKSKAKVVTKKTKAKAQVKPKTKPKTKAQTKPKPRVKPKAQPKAKTQAKPKPKAKYKPKAKPRRKAGLHQLDSEQLNSVYVKGGVELGSKNNKKEEQVLEFVQKNEKQHADTPELHLKPTSIKPDQGIKIPTSLDSNVRGEVEVEASLID